MVEATSFDKAIVDTVEALDDAELLEKPPKLPFFSAALTFQGNWQFNGAQVPHREALIPWLLRQCQVHANDDDMPQYADEKQGMKEQLKSISQTPSASLLTHIRTSFSHVGFERTTNYATHADYDRQLNPHSEVEQITELQKEFDVTEDDDERRILEESITGKILWLCWCGICAEVDELLPKVVDCIERKGNMMVSDTTPKHHRNRRRQGLVDICDIMDSTCVDPDDNLAHLQR
ncbi:hypothetical protein EDC04DRAFT_680004 [Pisolithus marmoratus]|nr:hypothetical protein EDC04DRAFT_680004 [Pisolithus marmoratus]